MQEHEGVCGRYYCRCSSRAGAAAPGCGSWIFLLAPPLGTVCSAGLGIGINWVINQDFNF